MFKTITLSEKCFDTRNSYPNRVEVWWGSPTSLTISLPVFFDSFHLFSVECPVFWDFS